jgi:hypothetical protein
MYVLHLPRRARNPPAAVILIEGPASSGYHKLLTTGRFPSEGYRHAIFCTPANGPTCSGPRRALAASIVLIDLGLVIAFLVTQRSYCACARLKLE